MKNTTSLQLTTPSEREILMTRVFDAPRQRVFEAHTKPELIRRWLLGPDGWSMPVCEVDFRVGGAYRYVWKRVSGAAEACGTEMAMSGVFKEIVVPERIVNTERFEQSWYPGEGLNTLTLTEKNGRTTLRQSMVYDSREIRDAVLKTGMESGVETSYDRLAKILAS